MRFFLCISLFLVTFTASAKTYRFVGGHFPKLFEKTQEGEYVGLGADLARKIAKDLNIEIEFELYPWRRAQEMMKQDKADVLIGAYPSKERKKFLTFSQHSFYKDDMFFFSLKENSITWQRDYSKLKGLSIGILSGWSYGEEFDQNQDKLNLTVASSLKQAVGMLKLKRLDLIATHWRGLNGELTSEQELSMIRALDNKITTNHGHYAFAKNDQLKEFIGRFDKAMEKIINGPDMKELLIKYKL